MAGARVFTSRCWAGAPPAGAADWRSPARTPPIRPHSQPRVLGGDDNCSECPGPPLAESPPPLGGGGDHFYIFTSGSSPPLSAGCLAG